MSGDRRYWDSSVFLEWLNEQSRRDACEGVLAAAEKGNILICTSAVTLGEVIKLKGQTHVPVEKRELIRNFFRQNYIYILNLTPTIGRRTQDLIWEHPHLQPRDAMHIATADCNDIPLIETFDRDFLRLDRDIGTPPIAIREPHEQYQPPLENLDR